jgi:molecular chaperone GrpE
MDCWKRSVADFENYKKREAETKRCAVSFYNLDLILNILPVIDNFRVSTEHIPEDQKDSHWVVGIMHIQRQLENILAENGVKEIEVKVGDNFDPAEHEAVEDREGKKEECKNIVKKVIQKGYKIGDRVIRPARVVVE